MVRRNGFREKEKERREKEKKQGSEREASPFATWFVSGVASRNRSCKPRRIIPVLAEFYGLPTSYRFV